LEDSSHYFNPSAQLGQDIANTAFFNAYNCPAKWLSRYIINSYLPMKSDILPTKEDVTLFISIILTPAGLFRAPSNFKKPDTDLLRNTAVNAP